MKSIFFHLQGYRDLPDDFKSKYESIWVDPPNQELCDPATVGKYMHWNLDELEYADELGFDGIGTNEHHSNGYGFPAAPNMTAGILARRKSDAAICLLGNTLPTYPPLRVAEEMAMIDCMSEGRLIAGWPVGTAMDTTGVFGITPTEVRPRFYESHDLIKQAWTRPGPFPFNGKFNKLRFVNPWPQPLQKPHPPIWLAGGGSVETYHFAATNNYTYNYLSFGGYIAGKALLKNYWDVVEQYPDLDDNPYRAGFAQLICVADTDAEAEKLYWPHIENFLSKSLHVAPHFAAVPGYTTRRSVEAMLKATGNATPFAEYWPGQHSWKEQVEKHAVVIAGSPETVVQRLTEAAKDLRFGHLIALMQIQSMDTELTKYSTKLYAEKVMPHLKNIWDGYEDHWWPTGATRGKGAATRLEVRS